jgi:hypothetical protein
MWRLLATTLILMSLIWSDTSWLTFPTGYAMSGSFLAGVGHGPSGENGVEKTGPSIDDPQFFLNLWADHSIAPAGRDFRIEADYDWSKIADNGGSGAPAMELMLGGSTILDLEVGRDVGDVDGVLFVSNEDFSYPIPKIILPGTKQTVRMCGTLASANGVPDGSVRVFVNDVQMFTLDNAPLYPGSGATYPVSGRYWDTLLFFLLGKYGNLQVYDSACPSSAITRSGQLSSPLAWLELGLS